jgi:TolB protein
VPSTGGSPRRLTHEHGNDERPAWSPDGRHIYFSSRRDSVLALWRVAADGTGAVRLTAGTGPEGDLSLSSDARRLAYTSSDVSSDIVLVDLRSGERTMLGGVRTEIGVDFSPDLSRMVFSSDRSGSYDLWVQPLQSGRPEGLPSRLTDLDGDEMLPVFSPDGGWIAYGRVLDDQRDVWVLGSGGGPSENFTDHPAVDLHPAWSPDGAFLAFSSNRAGQHHVWVAPFADGQSAGPARALTTGEATDMFPAWSPDGSEIAFRRDDGKDQDVWIVPSDGSAAPHQLTQGVSARQVRWEPDGQSLLVSGTWGEHSVSLRRVSAVTGEARPLAPAVVVGGAAAFGIFDLSDDGGLLGFVQEATAGDIWMLEASRRRF